jgi:NAD(P)-dependent dehydrogenase (short-subunit alcohol dehydrogenase family)
MKIVVIGATGTIGSAVLEALAPRHEVIGLSRHGDPSVDLRSTSSIEALFEKVSGVDAVVSCAGGAAWKPLEALTEEDFARSLADKLMGQVNLTRVALRHLPEKGSVTLTAGTLARSPMQNSAAVSLVNAGLEGFGRAAALEAPRGIRVNVVSPPWVTETLEKNKMTLPGLSARQVAKAYVAAVETDLNGETLDPAVF